MPDSGTHAEEHANSEPASLSESYAPRILLVLSIVFAAGYIMLGDRVLFGGHVATLELDAALRGALVGHYDPSTILPVALVAIDDATAAQPAPGRETWGFSGSTPRDKLGAMLGVIAAAAPASIIVDVDLSDDRREPLAASAMDTVLQSFLSSYRGPPLIFVKRADAEPEGIRLWPSTLFDPVIAANSRLSWAHALYDTDPDGTVRRWTEWIASCAPSGPLWLPSVPMRVLANWPDNSAARYPRPAAPVSTGPCSADAGKAPRHTVIYDEALLQSHAALSHDISRISAWQLLEPRIQRDDHALFAGKVVIIGGTRNGSADMWRTPVGMLYGVELIANTVRFAPGQLRDRGYAALYTLSFFAIFCALKHFLRPIVALAAGIVLCTVAAYVAGPYVILDAIQSAIVLFVELTIVEEIIILYLDARSFGWRFFVSNHLRRHI